MIFGQREVEKLVVFGSSLLKKWMIFEWFWSDLKGFGVILGDLTFFLKLWRGLLIFLKDVVFHGT